MKIMIVEDDPTVLGFLESWLLGWRHDVRGYVSSESAAEILRSWQPDLLLCDLGLPGTSGEELAQAAATLPHPARVVLMSGEQQRLETARTLAHALLLKPFTMGELMSQLDSAATSTGARPSLR
jgi:DNA-binding response OmpR family regulator